MTFCQQSTKIKTKSNVDRIYYLDMSSNELLHVTDEFLEQNSEHAKIKKPAKKGGPYSKNDKDKRMNEVYRLHFEYGYSARKIAEMMNVNRNTINGDIDYWFSRISNNVDFVNPENMVVTGITRMEIQLTRLREQLDKVKNNSERMAIERLIYDLNGKIIHTHEKLIQSTYSVHKLAIKWLNEYMEKNKKPERYLTWFETISVSQRAHEKIKSIIKNDKIY